VIAPSGTVSGYQPWSFPRSDLGIDNFLLPSVFTLRFSSFLVLRRETGLKKLLPPLSPTIFCPDDVVTPFICFVSFLSVLTQRLDDIFDSGFNKSPCPTLLSLVDTTSFSYPSPTMRIFSLFLLLRQGESVSHLSIFITFETTLSVRNHSLPLFTKNRLLMPPCPIVPSDPTLPVPFSR